MFFNSVLRRSLLCFLNILRKVSSDFEMEDEEDEFLKEFLAVLTYMLFNLIFYARWKNVFLRGKDRKMMKIAPLSEQCLKRPPKISIF